MILSRSEPDARKNHFDPYRYTRVLAYEIEQNELRFRLIVKCRRLGAQLETLSENLRTFLVYHALPV
jgi:hypothetical protein